MKTDIIATDNHWPTPIWRTRLEEVNNEALIRFILDEQIKAPQSIRKSNYGGWHSRQNLYDATETEELQQGIWEVCHKLWPFIEGVTPRGPAGIHFRQMWAMINKKHDWHTSHQDGMYEISGGYYLRAPKDCGNIVVQDPCILRNNNHFVNTFISNGDSRWYEPREHDLIMWPAYVSHYVEPSKSDEDRIMISFDMDIICHGSDIKRS